MHRLLCGAALIAISLGIPHASAAPAGPAPSNTVAGEVSPKPPLHLTDAQRQRVLAAINGRDTLDKPPADFSPAIGAKVPTQKKLAAHPLPRPLVYEIPVLKQYYYAQLPDQVLIIDPMTKEVVDIVRR